MTLVLNFRYLLFVFLLVVIAGCSKPNELTTFDGNVFGTTYHIVIADNITGADLLHEKIIERFVEIDNLVSNWNTSSEISNLNANSSIGKPIPLSTELSGMLKKSQEISKIVDGAFDITISPLVKAWGFGFDSTSAIPSDEILESLKQDVGYKYFEIANDLSTITKLRNVTFDLSAIAKGYTVDTIALMFRKLGIKNYLIEIGGELVTSGTKKNTPWTISIEKPSYQNRSAIKIIKFNKIAMATSGDYRNYREIDGKRISHIIDPRTAKPVKHKVASVTVLADSSELADAYATAFMVLGEKSLKMGDELGLGVYIIMRDIDKYVELSNSKFKFLTSETK